MPVRADRDIWILGDNFLTEAVSVLMEMQHQNKDELYIFSNYDPQVYYPKLLDKDTFGKQIMKLLFTALEEHNKLPYAMIIITGNKNVDSMVLNPTHTRRVWNALLTEIQRTIRTRKEDLPRKAQSDSEPKVFVTNMFPRFKDHCESKGDTMETFKTKRRRFNGILPQIVKEFDYGVLQITGILPDKPEFFSMSTGQLSGKGIKQYWSSLSSELKVEDCKAVEKEKNAIINAYFQKQREQKRIFNERQKIAKDRYSLSKGLASGDFKRGDRSRSVPYK